MNYFELHIGDYLRDASHLTPTEHGIYLLLLMRYYTDEAPIPDAQAHRYARAPRADVDPILAEFFARDGDVWRHRRVDAEIAKYRERVEHNRRVGALGGRPRMKPETGSEPKGSVPAPHQEPGCEPGNNPVGFRKEPGANPEQTLSRHQTPVDQDQDQERGHAADAAAPAPPRQNRGTRLPDDWQPEPELVTWTRTEAPAVDVARTLAQFRDYWRAQPGQKGVKTDWPATWRNWIRREAATVRGSGGPRAGPVENLQQRVARKNGLDRLFGDDDGQVGGALGRDGGHLRLALDS